jgi:hypothetical protein
MHIADFAARLLLHTSSEIDFNYEKQKAELRDGILWFATLLMVQKLTGGYGLFLFEELCGEIGIQRQKNQQG